MTDAELLLWKKLRRKQIHGLQFYRLSEKILTKSINFLMTSEKIKFILTREIP